MKINFNDDIFDYAAFEEGKESELARILRRVADDVENGRTYGTLRDYNGNRVGDWDMDA